jgi:pimeloyl-[acyl-carrier protein] methyl ester esterase
MLTLVLLPGMDGTGTLFAPFVAALGEAMPIQIVRYPLTPSLDYAGLEAFAQGTLPSDGPLVLLGESFSGPIAIALAAAMPERVKGLILCCSFARNPLPVLAPLKALTGLAPVAAVPLRLIAHFLLGDHATSPLRASLAQALAAVAPAVLRARLRAVLSVEASAALASIRVPVLYLRATHDRVVPRSASAHILSVCPHAQIVDVAGPHFLLQAAPSEAVSVVSDFAKGLPGA